jgi:phosphoserine aminotransferase
MTLDQPATRPARVRIRVFLPAPAPNPRSFARQAVRRAAWPVARAAVGKAKLKAAIETTRAILGVPEDYRIGIVPASDTGAVEMAMWSMLGARPCTMLAWESFGAGWVTDVVKQLKLDAEVKTAEYGEIVDLAHGRFRHRRRVHLERHDQRRALPDGDAIPADRAGLTICDATSSAPSRRTCPGTSSMSPPSPGRR